MSSFPRSPRLLKGALVSLDPQGRSPSVIEFQYNPDTLTRRVDARATGGEGDRSEAFRLSGPPKESITLSIEIDASDQLEKAEDTAQEMGIYPTLAALEGLLYPTTQKVLSDAQLARAGNIEIIPPEAPRTLLIWGDKRVLPVRLTSLSITEEAYDTALHPIRAKVDLTLNVLSYNDLQPDTPGYKLFYQHHLNLEEMARKKLGSSLRQTGATLKFS